MLYHYMNVEAVWDLNNCAPDIPQDLDAAPAAKYAEGYLPFQFGVRLLRKASMPSRKSSLI